MREGLVSRRCDFWAFEMADQLEKLRTCARLDWPAEVRLLVGILSADEWDRLGDLLRYWPPERGPIPRSRIWACLDQTGATE